MNKIVKIQLAPVDKGEMLEQVLAVCNFCDKSSDIPIGTYNDCLRLGHNRYYCPFCLKNRLTFKIKKDILLIDFKGIIGFYIYYLLDEKKIYYSQILNYIRRHQMVGEQHPLFQYDVDELTWFVDFRRVGNSPHKISIDSIKQNVDDIIESLDVSKINSISIDKLKEKYFLAIDDFYQHRKRPEDKRVLSPTLKNCVFRNNADWDATKDFIIPNKFLLDVFPVGKIKSFNYWSEDLSMPLVENLVVKLKSKLLNGQEGWEGLINIPGTSPTKLVSHEGKTFFENKTELDRSARLVAKMLGLKTKYQWANKKQEKEKKEK